MIQWINNGAGFFSIYRKFLQWDHTTKCLLKKEISLAPPRRPYEQFNELVSEAVKAGRITKKTPRNKWPIDMLENIFLSLKLSTPSNILSKELWNSCTTSMKWWEKTCRFARSVAVMSIVGFILGLGDRHLDNILMDIQSGEIIHIDFNVCFDKGKSLGIPGILN
jgi:hypothetical protein